MRGDVFHYEDRAYVPVKHEMKKEFFVALREAFLAWDPDVLRLLKAAMVAGGMSEEEVEREMYFNAHVFKGYVPRTVLPPSKLYWRVRAVFELYGPMVDSKTGVPLFNDQSWKKAQGVLNEIKLGYISDPPGVEMYMQQTDKHGRQLFNKYGFPLITSSRGTSDVENFHKQMLSLFGSWPLGIEMADALMAERRHRFNQRMSQRKRANFPCIGHYDAWLIDHLQQIVQRNHEILLYPGWSNAS